MTLKTNLAKWWIVFFALFMFISFAITLPTVSAQEGTPPISTATPIGTPGAETEKPSTNIFNT